MLEFDASVGTRTAHEAISEDDRRRMTMEFREPFPTITDVQQLEQVGFSREQIVGLLSIKALYQLGAYHEATPEHKRQAFVRWLYLQGRLES
jgi:hypothetical protein